MAACAARHALRSCTAFTAVERRPALCVWCTVKGEWVFLRLRDLSRFAMLVSYRPLARTGLAWRERVRDAIGGEKEVFGRGF